MGALPSIYKVFLALLRPSLQSWESTKRWPFASYRSGASSLKAVWDAAARSEIARSQGKCVVMVLLDYAAYYEGVDRCRLAEQAVIHEFPSAPPRLSLGMYAARRAITWMGIVQFTGYPSVGVVAGCSCATYHVQSFAASDESLSQPPSR